MNSYIVALTGGLGCGKSTVATQFAKLGVPLVDADVIARQLVRPGMPSFYAIKQYFGIDIINYNGYLNRIKLKKYIFNDLTKRNWLNLLLHPLIQRETVKQFYLLDVPYILWVVPLLIENNLQAYADRILVVDIDLKTQISRVQNRDNISKKYIENILKTQISQEKRLIYADDIINNEHIKAMKVSVNYLHKYYISLAYNNTFNKVIKFYHYS